ncbi:hypothetical protein KQI42_10655 [Tissierella sp. MSJ-40]|uniref:Phage protein n=1 Tax=Tissierella simiarum TaxID=2841534 RepID=A0ABS6E6D0_9FIRM|nr:hypothetical protein [Tissierella simiarum]MBU5438472.1 hypothetical protein [Tissierella simiarum]
MEKMTIKECGRYANFLDRTISNLIQISNYNLNSKIYSVTEIHKKSASYKEAEDEIVEVEYEDTLDIDIPELTNLLENLVEEKAQLADKIAEAKKDISIELEGKKPMNLDSSIEYAKLLRRLSSDYLNNLATKKDKKSKEKRTGYAFNVEGNQTAYYYETEIITSIVYDKEPLIKKDKETRKMADKISEKIEQAMSKNIVDFEPKYSYLDSIEDIVEKHLEK